VNGFVGRARRALAQTAMMVKNVTSTRRGNLALAAAFLVGVVIFGAWGVGTLEAIARLREHGLSANATITKVVEQDIQIPHGYDNGWHTTVTVSFTDTSGRLVRAGYTDRAEAGGKKAGQTIQIVYDPAKPTSIKPVGPDPRWVDAFIDGLAAVVWLGGSVYFAYRAWRWREEYSARARPVPHGEGKAAMITPWRRIALLVSMVLLVLALVLLYASTHLALSAVLFVLGVFFLIVGASTAFLKRLGQPTHDGKFQFTVTKVQTGVSRIGTTDLGKAAQGQFVLLYVTVRNIGGEAQTFDSSSQYVYDAATPHQYSADSDAAVYLDQSQSFLNDIHPGNAVSGIVVFDMPKGVSPTLATLHDSPSSAGVTINLK
jgi:hypothetical protein